MSFDQTSFRSIVVVGLGYVGLPTAAVFASEGLKVFGVDVSETVVETINSGSIHIEEPGLEDVVREMCAAGRLRAGAEAIEADAFLIAVPTPLKADGDPDLGYIRSACGTIAPALKSGDLVVLESTSPVGATERMADWLAELRPDLSLPQQAGENSDIRIAYCPERVLPGAALREFRSNDRVIGGMTAKCSARASQLYKIAVHGECVTTTPRTAELAKLTENSFRDVNIAFANELSAVCDRLGVSVWELIRLANRHPRVDVLRPGAGVGGHCIAVDPWFIVSGAPEEARLIRTAREVNDAKPKRILAKVERLIRDKTAGRGAGGAKPITVACYGVAFKPDIDDLRESPALRIAADICELGVGRTLVVEPHIEQLPAPLAQAEMADLADAIEEADIHVLLVAHTAFREVPADAWPEETIDAVGLLSI